MPTYACLSCDPPYRVPADGLEHPVAGQVRFDSVAVAVIDERTISMVLRHGTITVESTTVVSAAGDAKTETRLIADGLPRPYIFAVQSVRLDAPPAGAHLLSGGWRAVEADLVNHDEDTEFRIVHGRLRMDDQLGRSFDALLDGTIAPYEDDPRFTAVSVEWIDDWTIEEIDRSGEVVVQVTRWQVAPDGHTMHVRFDDRKGHVLEQSGQKVR